MDIEGISGAATVALTSTLVFVLIAKSWHTLSRSVSSTPNFSGSIMREAAQRFREEFDRLNASQSTYLGGGVVFGVLFVAAYVLQAGQLFAGYPGWQLYLLLSTLLAAALFASYRLTATALTRHRVKLRRDANIAIGHQLQHLAAGSDRTYHDVHTSAGIIDHMIVGTRGVFAVTVYALPARNNARALLDGHTLKLSPAGKSESVVSTNACIASLEREFRRLLDHRVRIRSVIAVPGWDVGETDGDEHLLVNEHTLCSLSETNNGGGTLTTADADALHKLLTIRCRIDARVEAA